MSATILVVDDEPAVRGMLTAWLQAGGYACADVPDAERALEHVATHHVDVALLDVALPGHDGLWLAGELRRRAPDVALIVVTGTQRFDIAVEGMRLGVLDYLLKPFSREDLMQSVRRAVEWRESLHRDRERDHALRQGIAHRQDELSGTFATLEQATAAALDALITTLAHRHPDAVAHARRVARMATALGRALRLDEATITDIERGALLHDIGKVAMPDALMQKPGPLTEEDIALIRTHVEVGREIVGAAPALAVAADIVGTSHEAWDGSGYPHGLTGEAIPIGARIIAIVDTFDALTWGRGDDDPVVYARAAAELVRCAGSQFDPDVVRAWLRVAEAGSPWSAAQRANGAARVQAVP